MPIATTHPWDVTVGLAAGHLAMLMQKHLPLKYRCQRLPQGGGQFELAAWQLLGGEADVLRLRANNASFYWSEPDAHQVNLTGSHFDIVIQLATLLDPALAAPGWYSLDFIGYEYLPVPISRQRAAEFGDSFQELLEEMRPALRRLFVTLNAEAFTAHPWLNVTSQRYAYVNRGGLDHDYIGILAMTDDRVAPTEATFPSLDLDGHEFVYHISDYILTGVIIRGINRLFFHLNDTHPAISHLPLRCTSPLYSLGATTNTQPQRENEPYEFIASKTGCPAYSIPEDKLLVPDVINHAPSELHRKFFIKYLLINYLYFSIEDGQIMLHYQSEAAIQTRVVFIDNNPFTLTTNVRQAYAYVLETSVDGHQTIGAAEVENSRQLIQTREPEHTDVELFVAGLSSFLGGLMDNTWFQIGTAVSLSPTAFIMMLTLNQIILAEAVYAMHDKINVSLLEQRLANLFTLPDFAGLNIKRVHLHQGLLVSGDLTHQ